MNATKISMGLGMALASLLLAGCESAVGAPQAPATDAVDNTTAEVSPGPMSMPDHFHPMTVDWVQVDTFNQLAAASDAVVYGEVVGRRFAPRRLYDYSAEKGRRLTAEEAGDNYGVLYLTESTVRIHRIVHAGAKAAALGEGDTIVVTELGGQVPDGCIMTPKDKPLLEKGDSVVLFLAAGSAPGRFRPVSGWHGRMYVVDGTIHSLASEVHPTVSEFTKFDGKTVDEVLAVAAAVPAAPLPMPGFGSSTVE